MSNQLSNFAPLAADDCIAVHDLVCYGYVGVDDTERAIGQRLTFDLVIKLDLQPAGESDRIEDTISYVNLCALITEHCAEHSHQLLECLLEQLATKILRAYERVQAVQLRVAKPHIAVPSFCGQAVVSINRLRPRKEP